MGNRHCGRKEAEGLQAMPHKENREGARRRRAGQGRRHAVAKVATQEFRFPEMTATSNDMNNSIGYSISYQNFANGCPAAAACSGTTRHAQEAGESTGIFAIFGDH
jgi:hypothetical protein